MWVTSLRALCNKTPLLMLFLSRIYIELTELEESVSFYTRILSIVDFQIIGIWKLNHNYVVFEYPKRIYLSQMNTNPHNCFLLGLKHVLWYASLHEYLWSLVPDPVVQTNRQLVNHTSVQRLSDQMLFESMVLMLHKRAITISTVLMMEVVIQFECQTKHFNH